MKAIFQVIPAWLMLVLAGMGVTPTASAADLQVSPTRIQFLPGDQSQSLWLTNSGTRTLQAQVRLFAWSQTVDDEVLEASQDFAVSPAMVSVEPGQRQLVRIIHRGGAVVEGSQPETSYRLLVDELPVTYQEEDAQAVQFVFRYSLPLFVRYLSRDNNDHLSSVIWQYSTVEEGLLLSVSNPGAKHIQIAGLSLTAGKQHLSVHKGLFGYVLAGQSRTWPIKVDNQALEKIDRIKATVNGESIETSISLRSDPQ